MSAAISINGKRYQGDSIQIIRQRVTVNGVDVTPEAKHITVEVLGNVGNLQVDHCPMVKVTGSAGMLRTMSGDIHCGDVHGGVVTVSGDVTCGSVTGDVGTVAGDVLVLPKRDGAHG